MLEITQMTETLPFKISGEFITNQARTFWVEGNEHKAIKFLMEAIDPLTESLAIEICIGKKKLIGINNSIKLINDNATAYRGKKLLSVAESFDKKRKKELYQKDRVHSNENETHNIKICIEPDPKLNSLNAWLSPEGLFYPCFGYAKHEEVASSLNMLSKDMDKQGWIKISDSTLFNTVPDDIFIGDKMPTETQKHVLREWCFKHNKKLPDFIED